MKLQRTYMKAILITAVTIPMILGCVGPKAERPQAELSKATDFIGKWCNKDFFTGGITRVHIRWVENNLRIHMWGRCHPTECDWGEESATIQEDGKLLIVEWHRSFVIKTQKLQLQPDGTLEVSTYSHYIDNSRREDRNRTDLFEKGLVHDWSDKDTEI